MPSPFVLFHLIQLFVSIYTLELLSTTLLRLRLIQLKSMKTQQCIK